MKAVSVVLFVRSAAMVQWDSAQMIRTKQADLTEQNKTWELLAKLQKENSKTHGMLTNHQTILGISTQQLHESKASATGVIGNAKVAKEKLAKDKADQNKKHEELQKAKEAYKKAYADLQKARAAKQEASDSFVHARSVVMNCTVAVDEASSFLQKEVVEHPDQVVAAQAALAQKKKELAAAKDVKVKALKDLNAKSGAAEKAAALADKCWTAEKAANVAASDADGRVTVDETNVRAAESGAQPKKAIIKKLTDAVDKEAGIVKTLQAKCDYLSGELNKTHEKLAAIGAELEKDKKCIADLEKLEAALAVKTQQANITATAYTYGDNATKKQLVGPLWLAKDATAIATFKLNKEQLKCARGVNVTPMPEPPTCSKQTDGGCRFLNCYQFRHAYCDQDGGYTCVCGPSRCAGDDGVCHDRGSPIAMSAVAGVEEGEEAVGSSMVACFVAAFVAVGGVIALVHRKGLATEVKMPEALLG